METLEEVCKVFKNTSFDQHAIKHYQHLLRFDLDLNEDIRSIKRQMTLEAMRLNRKQPNGEPPSPLHWEIPLLCEGINLDSYIIEPLIDCLKADRTVEKKTPSSWVYPKDGSFLHLEIDLQNSIVSDEVSGIIQNQKSILEWLRLNKLQDKSIQSTCLFHVRNVHQASNSFQYFHGALRDFDPFLSVVYSGMIGGEGWEKFRGPRPSPGFFVFCLGTSDLVLC